MERLHVQTRCRHGFVNVTDLVRRLVVKKGWLDGVLVVFSPHTTCGITLNEAVDPDVVADMCDFFTHLVPQASFYRHMEGNSDAHIKASLMGASQILFVEEGELRLGSWQGIFLCEGDGPRDRELWIQWIG